MGSQVYNSGSGNWTCPAGVTSVTVKVWGPGGSGGDITPSYDGAGGGGGGGYSQKTIAVTPTTEYSYSVGAGSSGATSWFYGVTTVLANGGANGVNDVEAGAAGGSVTGAYGDIKTAGANGTSGGYDSEYYYAWGGTGGASPNGGAGGAGGWGDDDYAIEGFSTPGTAPGGGGGGAGHSNEYGDYTGSAGAAGRVLIEWADAIAIPFQAICVM